jgi:Arc/MetJ-type ribon-helix-helix transcriptional regulator
MVRMASEEIAEIDAWIASEGPPFVTRPEAIRRLVRKALEKNDGALGRALCLKDFRPSLGENQRSTASGLPDISEEWVHCTHCWD